MVIGFGGIQRVKAIKKERKKENYAWISLVTGMPLKNTRFIRDE